MTDVEKAVAVFREKFGRNPDIAVFAPGRVNLIGEHTDYNEGFVLPFALPFRTVIVGSRVTASRASTVISCNAEGVAVFDVDKTLRKGMPTWANYIKGTIFQYINDLPFDAAIEAVITSDVPLGSGLSSSAALEVAMATFLEALFEISSTNGVEKALRCQKAEHTFADTPCGIMDQYISAMGRKGNLLLIDCRTQEGTLVPFGSGANAPVVLVTNSNVKHELSGSEYPDRVKQCQSAVIALKQKYPSLNSLRDADMNKLDSIKDTISSTVYARARHVISEDIRTLGTVEALRVGDFVTVGKLMSASHDSLQHDYEVSCSELDLLKSLAVEVPGVYGSRMTGGGFGGCTVTLVDRSAVPALKKYLQEKYQERTGKMCSFYEAEPSPGAGIIPLTSPPVQVGSAGLFDYAVPIGVVALALTVLFQALQSKN